jgi:phenylacetate-CoA ligase
MKVCIVEKGCPRIPIRIIPEEFIRGDRCPCGRTSFRIRCFARTDDMLTILGVNVYPSAIRDVVGLLRPKTTGEIQILLDLPGPAVTPPLKIKAEYGREIANLGELKKEIEDLLNARLNFKATVDLVPEGSLPRYEMKAQLIKKLWETQ